jgi:flagellar hook assembly protein FlgD
MLLLKIFNLMGNLVRVLSNDYQDAGSQKIVWDGKDAQGIELGSGSYLYEISISPAQLTGAPSFSQFVLRNVMIITR